MKSTFLRFISLLFLLSIGAGLSTLPSRPSRAETPEPKKAGDHEVENIQNEVYLRLRGLPGSKEIVVKVVPVSNGRFAIVLSGKLTKRQLQSAESLLREAGIPGVTLILAPVRDAGWEKNLRTNVYRLPYLKPSRLSALLAMLNDTYGAPGIPDVLVAQSVGRDLVIRSTHEEYKEIKQLLDKITPDDPSQDTEVYELTFLGTRVTPTSPERTIAPTSDRADSFIEALNAIFGGTKESRVVTRTGRYVIVDAQKDDRERILHYLGRYDAAWPQVRIDLFPIQVSGSGERVEKYLLKLNEEFRRTQVTLRAVNEVVTRGISTQASFDKNSDDYNKQTLSMLEDLGFKKDSQRPLTLTEAFIFLTLQNKATRLSIFESLNQRVEALVKTSNIPSVKGQKKQSGKVLTNLARVYSLIPKEDGHLIDISDAGEVSGNPVQRGVRELARAALAYYNPNRLPACYEEDKRKDFGKKLADLQNATATADRLLKLAYDAYAADMREAFLDPFLERAQDLPGKNGGIVLAGTSRMVVTSTIESSLAAEMVSYANATRPRPFRPDLLDTALPAPSRTKSTTAPVLKDDGTPVLGPDGKPLTKTTTEPVDPAPTGSQALFATLPPAASLALAAAFQDAVPPSYLRIAPGIAVNIIPTVFPDGGTARLQIDMRFGVKTSFTDEGTQRDDIFRSPPPDAVESHSFRTDAAIAAFDLFDISTIAFDTSSPQAPFYIPILGRLPVLGPIFQLPRGNKRTYHTSVVLVNAVILPRSLDLLGRQFRNSNPIPFDGK